MENMIELGMRARAASKQLASADSQDRGKALKLIAKMLLDNAESILEKNALDIERARVTGLRESMIERLTLNAARIKDISGAVIMVAEMQDPVGRVLDGHVMKNGARIYKTRVPLGVVGMIYESRPNVTVDAAVLCLKSGNVSILRGGKEAINTNMALAAIMRGALKQSGLPEDAVILVEDTSRASSEAMMKLTGYIDVLVPRGGAGLIRSVVENARVPVIETGIGNCHVYVDYNADIDMAVNITDNAKTQRPSVCNAAETLLVHRALADGFLKRLKPRLDRHSVELRGCPETRAILGDCVLPATQEDYAAEFCDYILAVKVVGDVREAIEHIDKYGTKHSECIVTNDYKNSRIFTGMVDAAAVYVNMSTRFTDGGEFGMGAELGISTQKLHARGPMGLTELTTTKYVIMGDGQIRA